MSEDRLVNNYFNDFPIDFFTFKEEDFNNSLSSDVFTFEKQPLEIQDGFIGNSLYNKINFSEKETTVVNCAVGQGKTSAILHSIKEYLNTEDSINTYFIIAVPLVSLVTQYKRDLLELGFEENQIYSYESISDNIPESGEDYIDVNCKIHLVTVNTLLGNAGEHAILQSPRKYNYIKAFSHELSSTGKQLIIIYDEIHEAIRNFTPTGIAYLSHFSGVISKNILLSATYNIQSIPVIKLLANQTDYKIRVLESERKVVREQSQLFLHYHNQYGVKNHKAITEIIRSLVTRNKNIDVLCYSKKLCKALLNTDKEPGRMLSEKFGTLRDCTSSIEGNQGDNDENLNRNRFDNSFCNIGTNFKSGVNITKTNHAFVVVLPPASARGTYANYSSIYSEGINAVIQAIARQRTTGEIHIILPRPIMMDYESLPTDMNTVQKEKFIQTFNKICIPVSTVPSTNNVRILPTKYISFSEHIEVGKRWWKNQQERFRIPLLLKPDLKLPDFDSFILTYGEKCTSRESFLGRDLSSFVTYAAFTNQFFNTKLHSYYAPSDVNYDNIEEILTETYSDIEEDENISSKFYLLESSLDLSRADDSLKRSLRQQTLNFVLDNETNISTITSEDIKPAIRFIISYFNNFLNESPNELETQIIHFRSLVDHNIIIRTNTSYYKPYDMSQIFSGQASSIKNIIEQLKGIYPLGEDFANFFDSYNTLSDEALEDRFYEFIIKTKCKAESHQLMINGIRKNHHKVIRIF